jgi:hypothetical protein
MKRSILILTLISLMVPQALGQAPKQSVYSRVAQASIRTEDLLAEPRPTTIEEALHPSMSETLKYATVLNLFSSVDMTQPGKNLVEQQAWQDLELFPSVFSVIDRTVTVFGKSELGAMLAGEKQITDIAELERRQQVVKALVQNPSLFNALEKVLGYFKKAEESFLIFFLEQNSARQRILSSFYFDRNIVNFQPAAAPIIDSFDTSPTALLANGFLDRMALFLSIIGFITTIKIFISFFREGGATPPGPREAGLFALLSTTFGLGLHKLERGVAGLNILNDIFPYPKKPFQIINGFKFMAQATRIVQKDLMNLAQACKTMRAASKFLSQKTNIKELMPECNALFAMFEQPENNPEDVNKLLTLLRTDTFKGKPSMFSHYGRVFAANRLMDTSKEHWVSVFKAIGQLDVYLSIAKLVKEFEQERIHYCFPTFIHAARPVLVLQDFWNPCLLLSIKSDEVVANTISLGQGPRSIIITGPNSGGKSVVLKSVGLAAHLAQTLGVTPASQATLTPLSTINTLINVSDAIPAGLSRFRAEVAQAQNLRDKLDAQKPHEFNLIVSDELFSSTSEDQAEELIYEYAKIFAKPNNICLQATHHPKQMIRLENEVKEGGAPVFANYKVDIDLLPNGKLQRNFKLQRGVSTQKFARKILQELKALP